MPTISIITANLNNAKGLCRTIKSVEGQTYSDYEFVIIDGGSTDNSLDVIKRYSKKIACWLSEPDCGVYDALNKGIKIAKGEWIIFLNSGDAFNSNNVLEQIFSYYFDNQTQIIYGNTIVKENHKKIKPPSKINKNFFFYETICHQSIFFKRTIFNIIGIHNLNYKIISDREFLLRAAIKNINFTYIDVDVCLWEAAGLSSKSINTLNDEFMVMKNIYFNVFEKGILHFLGKIASYKGKISNNFSAKRSSKTQSK